MWPMHSTFPNRFIGPAQKEIIGKWGWKISNPGRPAWLRSAPPRGSDGVLDHRLQYL
jgi:hypothetical protein